MPDKYVFCLPRGCGFNDVLCQINVAYQFAQKTNRTLMVDTRLSGLADSLSDYFELTTINASIILDVKSKNLNNLNQLSCFPQKYEGKLQWIYHRFMAIDAKKIYQWPYFNAIRNIINIITYALNCSELNSILQKTSFILNHFETRKNNFQIELDKLENHPVDIIVHHMSGGGEDSIRTLEILKLKKSIINIINSTTNFLGSDYDAIHIRNTDYESDFVSFLEQIKRKLLNRRILLCTDNFNVIKVARTILNQSEVITIKKYYPKSKKNNIPIHFQWHLSKEKIRSNNISMLADLLAMANAKSIFYPELIENIHKARVSGFSLLVKNLKSRPDLVNQLVKING
jgi:hypothetical protein